MDPAGDTAIGGGIGVLFGSFIGYFSAQAAAGYLFDFAQDNVFLPAPEVPVPAG